MSTRMPLPTARSAVPMAAVVLPLPGPVFTMMSPRRGSVMAWPRDHGGGRRNLGTGSSRTSVGPGEDGDLIRVFAGVNALAGAAGLVERQATDGGLGFFLDFFF